MDAISVDLSVRPPLIKVVGAARAIDEGPVVTAVIDRGPNSDGFWFFEVQAPFAAPATFGPACALFVSLAYLVDTSTSTSNHKGQATAVVLRAEKLDLYLITTNAPASSPLRAPLWTSYTLAFDSSLPWRIAGKSRLVKGIERVSTTPSIDALATTEQIRETLASLTSIRIRGGGPDAAEMVLLRQLAVLRVDTQALDREPAYNQ